MTHTKAPARKIVPVTLRYGNGARRSVIKSPEHQKQATNKLASRLTKIWLRELRGTLTQDLPRWHDDILRYD